MMATGDGTSPSGGYVALERFTGTLDGKSGSYIPRHSGIMAPGMMEIHIVVSPGSRTDDLAGITGTLDRDSRRRQEALLHGPLPVAVA